MGGEQNFFGAPPKKYIDFGDFNARNGIFLEAQGGAIWTRKRHVFLQIFVARKICSILGESKIITSKQAIFHVFSNVINYNEAVSKIH